MNERTRGTTESAMVALLDLRAYCMRLRAGAEDLRRALAGVVLEAALRSKVSALDQTMMSLSREVGGELQAVEEVTVATEAETEELLRTLTSVEARFMSVLDDAAGVVEALELAAERDARLEPAYVAVVETVTALLRQFERVTESTRALQGTMRD